MSMAMNRGPSYTGVSLNSTTELDVGYSDDTRDSQSSISTQGRALDPTDKTGMRYTS